MKIAKGKTALSLFLALIMSLSLAAPAGAVPRPEDPVYPVYDGDTEDTLIIDEEVADCIDPEEDQPKQPGVPAIEPEPDYGYGEYAVIRTGLVTGITRLTEVIFRNGYVRKDITYREATPSEAMHAGPDDRGALLYDGRGDSRGTIVTIRAQYGRPLTEWEAEKLGWHTEDSEFIERAVMLGMTRTTFRFVAEDGREIHAPLYCRTAGTGNFVIGYAPVLEIAGYTPEDGLLPDDLSAVYGNGAEYEIRYTATDTAPLEPELPEWVPPIPPIPAEPIPVPYEPEPEPVPELLPEPPEPPVPPAAEEILCYYPAPKPIA